MNKISLFFPALLIGLFLLMPSVLRAQVIDIPWSVFLGSVDDDRGWAITTDSSGNCYITGESDSTWGSPVSAHSGGDDAFVACLDSSGNLVWNTFLGSALIDRGQGIGLDSSENVYVVGYSIGTWGTPVNAHSGGYDGFVACLDSSGNLVWNTFLGSSINDESYDIILNSSGTIYVVGYSDSTWGTPVNAYIGSFDVFVACLNSSGSLQWNTFLGSTSTDFGYGIALDGSGNVCIAGTSYITWGSPVHAHSGNDDVLAACLDSSGNRLWHTFLGSADWDYGADIIADNSGNIYLTGNSQSTWGTPVNPYNGGTDALVACLNSSGSLIWHTFVGSSSGDYGRGIALDGSGNIYMAGYSYSTWGLPEHAHTGSYDVCAVKLSSSGNVVWNTFLGSNDYDYGYGITLDSWNNIYLTGDSRADWSSSDTIRNGTGRAFVSKIMPLPAPEIKANGSDGPISITGSDTLQIRVSLNSNGSIANVDFWLAYRGPSGWIHYNNSTKKWEPGLGVTYQGALFDIYNKKVFQKSGLAPGTYTFYFGVDMSMDGKVTKSSLYKDEVKVTVNSD